MDQSPDFAVLLALPTRFVESLPLERVIVVRTFAPDPQGDVADQIYGHEEDAPLFVLSDVDQLVLAASVEVAIGAAQHDVAEGGYRRAAIEREATEDYGKGSAPKLQDSPLSLDVTAADQSHAADHQSQHGPRYRPENFNAQST